MLSMVPAGRGSLGRRIGLAAIGGVVFAAACSETAVPPLVPSALPGEKVQVLSLACAASVSRQSFSGGAVQVQYGPPRVGGGLEPVATECTPASGAAFPVGISMVRCTAQDGLQQTASCALSVTVVPTLSVTTILAFGDSLTAGTTASPVPTIVQLDPASSYPTKLRALLNQRYSAQAIRVLNAGLPGEKTVNAVSRLQSELARERPDVLLLMEGTNDLGAVTTAGGDAAAAAIDSMVRDARARGVDPMLATIPPQRAFLATAPQVIPYNDRIRQIAAAQGVPLVDVHQILTSGQCIGGQFLSCIGEDGIHPTTVGYDLVADAFFRRIMAIYEARAGGPSVVTQTQMPAELLPGILRPPGAVAPN